MPPHGFFYFKGGNMNQSQDINELSKAMLQIQQNLLPALRDATNPFTKSNYATLNSVMDSCREALLTHGIWLTQLPCPTPVELDGTYRAGNTTHSCGIRAVDIFNGGHSVAQKRSTGYGVRDYLCPQVFAMRYARYRDRRR